MSIAPVEVVDELAGLDFDTARACEHSEHQRHLGHADGDEAFVIVFSPCGCEEPVTVVFCGAWVEFTRNRPDYPLRCGFCNERVPARDLYMVIGPVKEAP